MKLHELVYECLRSQPGQRLSSREIAEWIFEHYRDWAEAKRQRAEDPSKYNTDQKLINQITGEISASHSKITAKFPYLRVVDQSPRLLYYSEETDEQEALDAESLASTEGKSLAEKDLYPLLAQYLVDKLKVWSLRISEAKSSNSKGSGGNKWLFPDLVGLEDLTADWNPTILSCVKMLPETRARLWSFEVKTVVSRSNVREVFFQVVSNSSWANLAYLVAAEYHGEDTLPELRRLSGLHGVGAIFLNVKNPFESQILIPARERSSVDWNTASRIAEENPDFRGYIERIQEFYTINKIRSAEWLAQPTKESD